MSGLTLCMCVRARVFVLFLFVDLFVRRLDWSVAVDRMLQDEQESNRKNSGICPLKDSPH